MPTLDDARRLYATLHPIEDEVAAGADDPCVVKCECGYYGVATTFRLAQQMAWAHDAEHWAGRIGVLAQGSLFGDTPVDDPVEDDAED